ncbi:DUF4347 domain-containing protein [Muricauda sp. CAU 1633]|uniref:DUF4347 domain-containing protein n=1 Tax=Allomuricauda sp. CAU 1633 TaxID=2816036 RepID=UPI001A90522A|nr:DUF4347 domain-containing protein [Muricauda sp. CAU 1633]MBO0321903.1 DUF4347 domain-containing protein [Muricauda sp. CAU 1633]
MRNLMYRKTFSIAIFLFTVTISGVFAQSTDVVLIDSEYAQKQQVVDHLPSGVSVVEIKGINNPWQSIREYLEQNRSTTVVHLFANTSYNALELGGKTYNSNAVDQEFELSMLEGLYQGTNLQLLIYDCNLGSNPEGLSLLKKISDKAYFNIAVPTNCSSVFGADLEFDHTTMNQPTHNSIFQ